MAFQALEPPVLTVTTPTIIREIIAEPYKVYSMFFRAGMVLPAKEGHSPQPISSMYKVIG